MNSSAQFGRNMKTQLLITAVGEDRPGIVARLSAVFVKNGGNLEESRMSILGGEFAAIILISIDQTKVETLKRELSTLQDETITVTTKVTQPASAARFAQCNRYQITLTGADHEGIVYELSTFLSNHAINIQSMDTDVVPAPETGTPLFRMRAVIFVPLSISLVELQKHLQRIGNQECVDIVVCELSAGENGNTVIVGSGMQNTR